MPQSQNPYYNRVNELTDPREQQIITEVLNKRLMPVEDPNSVYLGEDLPRVSHPGGFRQEPTVIGSPRLARLVAEFLRYAPELRGRLNNVRYGVDANTMEQQGVFSRVFKNALPENVAIDRFPVAAAAIADPQRGAIALSPNYNFDYFPRQFRGTVGHELGHIVGLQHGEPSMLQLEDTLAPEYFKVQRPNQYIAK